MTEEPAAVVARFVAFRTVPARGVMVLTLDVPIDAGPGALEALGTPQLGSSVHVALARVGGPATPGVLAVNGTYEGIRTVGGRNALALTIDVPAERSFLVFKSLGMPTSKVPIDVLIALLVAPPAPTPPPELRRTAGQLAVQQAAMRCKEPVFQRFLLGELYVKGASIANETRTRTRQCALLQVESRGELAVNREALRRWHEMASDFETWQQRGGADGEDEA